MQTKRIYINTSLKHVQCFLSLTNIHKANIASSCAQSIRAVNSFHNQQRPIGKHKYFSFLFYLNLIVLDAIVKLDLHNEGIFFCNHMLISIHLFLSNTSSYRCIDLAFSNDNLESMHMVSPYHIKAL